MNVKKMKALAGQGEESFYVEFDSTIGWAVYGSETGVFCNAFRNKDDAEEFCGQCISLLNSFYFSNEIEELLNNPFSDLIDRILRYTRCRISDLKTWADISNIDKFPDYLIQKDLLEIIREY
jgi:hypothetical protein